MTLVGYGLTTAGMGVISLAMLVLLNLISDRLSSIDRKRVWSPGGWHDEGLRMPWFLSGMLMFVTLFGAMMSRPWGEPVGLIRFLTPGILFAVLLLPEMPFAPARLKKLWIRDMAHCASHLVVGFFWGLFLRKLEFLALVMGWLEG
jgi:hypothetical protein